MEITAINAISEFDSTITSITTTSSLFSRFLSNLKYGALLIALLYAFNGVAYKLKLFLFPLHKLNLATADGVQLDPDDEFSSDDDETDTVESPSSSDDEEEEDLSRYDRDFRVAGSSNRKFVLKRPRSIGEFNFSLSELLDGNKIVKFYDNLGLELGLDDDSSSRNKNDLISVFDLNKDVKIGSFSGEIPAISSSSPAVILTAGNTGRENCAVNFWDIRLRRRLPAVKAEWTTPARRVTVDSGGVKKVYVRGDRKGLLTVGDVRKVGTPLENVTEFDGDTWWDADAVIVTEED